MRIFKHVVKSIGLMQAMALLLASLFIGLGLSAIQLGYILTKQRQDAMGFIQEIVTLAEGGATTSAWTLDPNLAEKVVKSIMAVNGVQEAAIFDEDGAVLAEAEGDDFVGSRLIVWLANTFIGDEIGRQRKLSVTVGGRLLEVGALSVRLAPTHIADGFVALAMTTVIATVIQALLVGLILLWLSSCLVTGPLRCVAKAIADINTERPSATLLPIPRAHEHNELGYLLRRTNQMLERLCKAQQELRDLATRDTLTNLPNRALITNNLAKAISRAKYSGSRLAVMFLDIDRFKNINDSLGHDKGDELLVAVARMLSGAVRSHDSVGRLGGDEFLIVLDGIQDMNEVRSIVERIADVLFQPCLLGHHKVRATASIGIAIFPDDAEDTGSLMRQADLAMYDAKGKGGAGWSFFAKEISDRSGSNPRIETALNHALDRNELRLVFQPKIDAHRGSLAGCEALLRWCSGGRGLAVGMVAEDTESIEGLGEWVLEQVCYQIQDWTKRFGPTAVSLNVSSRQLQENDFVFRILRAIRHHDIDPRLFELEVTETGLIEDLDRNIECLNQLRSEGVMISIDDFGTGCSPLSHLARLPISAIKIDRSFFSGSQSAKIIMENLIVMARALRLKTVVGGIEADDQFDWLRARHCDVLQGNYISEPLEAGEFERRFLGEPAFQLAR